LNQSGEVDLGRITKDSMRSRLQNNMSHLRDYYLMALKDNQLQDSFEEIWKDWNLEQGAMIYAQVVSAYDLLNLTGVLANRREITVLRQRIDALENRSRAG
jgi:hypothetical protein